MLLEWEVNWKWKEWNYEKLLIEIDKYEDKVLREIVWRLLIFTTSSKGTGKATVGKLIVNYESWRALETVAKGIFDYLNVEIFPKGNDVQKDVPERMMEMWNELTPFPKVKMLNSERRQKCRTRWKEFPEPKLQFWEDCLNRAAASRFLNGANDRQWVATFDFLLQPNSAAKVCEGKYDDKTISKAVEGGGFESLKNFGWGKK